VLFDVCRHRDRFNILQAAEDGAFAPIQELADGVIISDPRVLVADGVKRRIILRDFCCIILRTQPGSGNEESRKNSEDKARQAWSPSPYAR
jgi:hypothetical protein